MKKSMPVVGREERRKFWERHVSQWRESGMSQMGYCRQEGLSHKSFVYWKKRVSGTNAVISLVELPLQSPEHRVSSPLRLRIGGLYCIEIERGFDAETLRRVLGVL